MLWFSTVQSWEPTASKGIVINGKYRTATMREMKELAGGLVRLGYPQSELTPWPRLAKEADIRSRDRKALEKVGKAMGANPLRWHGCFHSIPVSELVVEIMNEQDQWEPLQVPNQREAA